MSKILDFLKGIPNIYYNWRNRNERIDKLLNNYTDVLERIDKLQSSYDDRAKIVEGLEASINHILDRLDVVKQGTRMELFETLHNWRQLLVVKRGWASPEEKKEIEEIFTIYHNELHGNGNGERYYNEIIALPESREEMEERLRNV